MPAPPLLYPQVRMLAEAALGLPDRERAVFYFDPGNTNGPAMLPPGAALPATDVLVAAYNETLQIPVTVRINVAAGGVDLVPQADAVFWTDAAVQKFVLPYYVSCNGIDAWQKLTTLQQVWNGAFPAAANLQVIALVHVAGTADGEVEPLRVVFQLNGAVQMQSLADFTDNLLPSLNLTLPTLSTPALPSPQPYTQPSAAALQRGPTYGALRSLAEWAASLTADVQYFHYDPFTNTFSPPDSDPGDGSGIVIPVSNPPVPGNRPQVTSVDVTYNGATSNLYALMSYENAPGDEAANYPDAYFWSTGAIEQFMLPYYASIDGFAGLADLSAIRDCWMAAPQHEGEGGWFTGSETGSFVGPEADELLGLVHIPRSVWVTEETAASQESGFVRVDRDGRVRVTPARDLIGKGERGG